MVEACSEVQLHKGSKDHTMRARLDTVVTFKVTKETNNKRQKGIYWDVEVENTALNFKHSK